jgi:hypothetical protein
MCDMVKEIIGDLVLDSFNRLVEKFCR